MKKYIIRNKKILIVDKPRKLTKNMGPKDMAPEYLEKQQVIDETVPHNDIEESHKPG
jgi:hypothetical protein